MPPRKCGVLLITLVCFLPACAGLSLQSRPVHFEDPALKLAIRPAMPLPGEEEGIVLRWNPPESFVEHFREETDLYARIHKGQGLHMLLVQHRKNLYRPGSSEQSYLLTSESLFAGESGMLREEMEIDTRGGIVRFVNGRHESRIGKFEIQSWQREPFLPEGKVRIGGRWSYSEEMNVLLKSALVKQKNPEPFRLQAESVLQGFAYVGDRRAAVIKTTAVQKRREHLKVLWTDIIVRIVTRIEETTYLDYQEGSVLAKVTVSESETLDEKGSLLDQGRSQSILQRL